MTPGTKQSLEAAIRDLGGLAEKEVSESYNRIGAVLDFVKTYTEGYEGKRVLDIGCSIGIHALAAIHEGAQVTGLDKYTFPETSSSPFQLTKQEFAHASSVWSSRGLTMVFHDVDAALPFADDTFDLVVSNAVIEHLHGSHKRVFSEIYRILKPGGALVLTTPNLAFISKRIRFLIGRSPNWDLKDFFDSESGFTGHSREFTVAECQMMAQWVGFTVLRARAYPTYFRWVWLKQPKKYVRIFFYLLGYLSSRFGDHVFLAAKKP